MKEIVTIRNGLAALVTTPKLWPEMGIVYITEAPDFGGTDVIELAEAV